MGRIQATIPWCKRIGTLHKRTFFPCDGQGKNKENWLFLQEIQCKFHKLIGWRLRTGWPGFDSRQRQAFFFVTASRSVLGPIQVTNQWIPSAFSLRVKQSQRKADHSPPSNAEVKNTRSNTSTPVYVFMARCLMKHRKNFAFHFTLPLLFEAKYVGTFLYVLTMLCHHSFMFHSLLL
jgi:hypothetical protein